MDVFKREKQMSAEPTLDTTHAETTAEELNSCALCGTNLKFDHEVNYSRLTVREHAHCPACQIRLRARDFVLH